MKALGIIRKLDELGRLVIPMEIRKANGWGTNQPMELFAVDGGIVIKPFGKEAERKEVLDQLEHLHTTTENDEVFRIVTNAMEFIKRQG